jgi:hypothetical protein
LYVLIIFRYFYYLIDCYVSGIIRNYNFKKGIVCLNNFIFLCFCIIRNYNFKKVSHVLIILDIFITWLIVMFVSVSDMLF